MTYGALWTDGLKNGANGTSGWTCARAADGSIHCISCNQVYSPIGVYARLINWQLHLGGTSCEEQGAKIPLLTRLCVRRCQLKFIRSSYFRISPSFISAVPNWNEAKQSSNDPSLCGILRFRSILSPWQVFRSPWIRNKDARLHKPSCLILWRS